jgi:glycosyltransferase involved in cell wall biosynthesis
VIPNGVTIAERAARPPATGCERLAVALGRLHPKKGFVALIEAWHRVAVPGWRLVIAGPDESGHAAELRAAVADRRCTTIDVAGPRYGQDRKDLLDRAHLSICSSYSENFGMVVAEAMERSLAVVTTTGTPWRHLATNGMGWCVAPGVTGLSAALAEALSLPQAALDAMGAAGRRYVEAEFGWEGVARSMRSAYEWLRGGGPPPPCIQVA